MNWLTPHRGALKIASARAERLFIGECLSLQGNRFQASQFSEYLAPRSLPNIERPLAANSLN